MPNQTPTCTSMKARLMAAFFISSIHPSCRSLSVHSCSLPYSIFSTFLQKAHSFAFFCLALTLIVSQVELLLTQLFDNISKMQFFKFFAVFGLAAVAAAAPQEDSESSSMTSMTSMDATATSSMADMTTSSATLSPTTVCVLDCESISPYPSYPTELRY